MILFDNHDTLFETIHGGKYYTLCRSSNGRELTDHVCLRKIPTKAEAKLILDTLHFPKIKLAAWDGMEQIKFADEK